MSSNNNSKRDTEKKQSNSSYPELKPHYEKVLIIVKTAPHPSVKYKEIVCTAGITEKGKLIRLYPINFRYLGYSKWYKKYQWIRVKIKRRDKSKDNRVDSYRPFVKTIKPVGDPLPPGDWEKRKKIVMPLISSFSQIKRNYKRKGASLGIFKPEKIIDLVMEEADEQWKPKHRKILSQQKLFGNQPKKLEKIPYKFSYKFRCDDSQCSTEHKMQITDWEIYRLYSKLKNDYNYSMDVILKKIKEKWVDQMWSPERDSYLIVGTTRRFGTFIVLGVFWPPK